MTDDRYSISLSQDEIHVLVRALDTYSGDAQLRSQEARETAGRMRTHLNEGVPAAGLDPDALYALSQAAERLTDRLIGLVPPGAPITALYEDGSPLPGSIVDGFPLPASSALYLHRPLATTSGLSND